MKKFPLYFSRGESGWLLIPDRMTEEDFALMKTQISDAVTVARATTQFVPAAAPPGENTVSECNES